MRIKDAASGVLSQLTDEDKSFLPFLMYKEHGKGKIILINSNPLMKVWYNEIVFNSYENKDFYIIRIRQASFLIFKNFDFPALFLKRFSLKDLLEKYFKYNENVAFIKPLPNDIYKSGIYYNDYVMYL